MNIYIAHNYAARSILRESLIPIIEEAGHTVTSRWIKYEKDQPTNLEMALEDLEDLSNSDILLFYTANFGGIPGRGKYIEFGFALRAGIKIIIIGIEKEDDCVFFHLRNIVTLPDIWEVISFLPSLASKQPQTSQAPSCL